MSDELYVLGLVGTVGAGKSSVAGVLRALGYVVYDADAESRRVFELDDVQHTMKQWWGDRVVGTSGRVERSLVGAVVFDAPGERARLEGLIHPRLSDARLEAGRTAARTSALGLVLDAPLLFEAGLDRECDAVVCVDAPFSVRAERVRGSRSWDEAELRRRDASQMPIGDKRARCGAVIENVGPLDGLAARVDEALERVGAPRPSSKSRTNRNRPNAG